MKTIVFCLTILVSTPLIAQDLGSRIDIRFGVGRSLLGSGDMRTTVFENELNYRLNPLFTAAASICYGRSNQGVYESASFTQGNLDLFFSPFKNTKSNDFRIGGGLSLYNVSDAREGDSYFNEEGMHIIHYEFETRQSLGFNVVIENTYSVADRYLLGIKIFTQPYFNGDINSGIMLKTGVRL